MAEAALLGVGKSLLQQLASPASNEFLLIWNFNKDLNRLAETVQTITDFLHDAEQRESKEVLMKRWLSRLRSTLYDADDLFDAVAARALRKKVMSGNTFMKEVRLFFSISNQLGFVVRIAHDVKEIKERLDDIKEDMRPFNFQSLKVEENFSLMNLNRETHSFVDVKKVIGRDDDREKIISLLLSEKTGHRNLSVISIIGFGGFTLYPKDHDFDKDELVCMWVAQGFLEPSAKKSLEEVGDECFFYMVDRSFFQEVKEDRENDNIRYTCKMHDLAIQVAGLESGRFHMEGDSGVMVEKRTLRHISATWNPTFPPDNFALSSHSKTLRTLILDYDKQFERSSLNSILS